MILHYLKTGIRRIKSHRGFTVLNVAGLTLGISSCLLIILYIKFELGFDKFHENEPNIYRVVMHQPGNKVVGSSSDWWVVSPFILKPTWESELPDIDLVSRTTKRTLAFEYQDQFIDEDILIVDPEFLQVFTFPLRTGNKENVLKNPYSIVISEKMAKKYFGDHDPMGKTLMTNQGKLFQVTGVLQEMPKNSHLQFDFLVSFETLESLSGRSLLSTNWLNNGYRTYLTLDENTNLQAFDAKLRKYNIDGFNGQTWTFHLQPLSDIHFNRQISGTGDKGTLFIFLSVGVFILFIACFNYINLCIAHYTTRTKNIGIRKVAGATRMQLIQQFLSESFLLVFLSYILSIAIVWLVLPLFNAFLGQELDFKLLWNYQVLISSTGVVFLMGLLSGGYPAFYLSGLHIIRAIKGGKEKLSKGALRLRKGMVVVQFSVSIILLMGSVTVHKQLRYAGNKSLGYDKEYIIYMPAGGLITRNNGEVKNNIEAFKQELLKNSNIVNAAASTGIPSQIGWSNIPVWEGKSETENPFFYRLEVDFDFFELYGLEIEQGRYFSKDIGSDRDNAYILNQAAVTRLGFQSPVGAKFGFDDTMGSVVGVVKDFHFESLHKPITPLGIGIPKDNNRFSYLSVKINSQDMQGTLQYIEDLWHNFAGNTPFKYSFVDEQVALLYAKDQQLSESLGYFTMMALFISCLGIFGIMSFSIKQRTKEIGIRKVLGASVLNLLRLLSKDIFAIIGLATVAGGILGWYVSNQWLNNFAYRFDMGFDIIIAPSVITLMMALIPVSYKLVKSAIANPVESLRTE